MKNRIVRFILRNKIRLAISLAVIVIGGVAVGVLAWQKPQAFSVVQESVAAAIAVIPKAVPETSPSVSPDPFLKFEAEIMTLKEGLLAVQEGYTKDAGQRQDLIARFEATSSKLDEQQKLLQAKAATLDTAIAGLNKQLAALDGQVVDTTAIPTVSPSASPSTSSKININTATITELDVLPGVGPVTAQNIITYRTEHGPFASVDDLANVSRISPAMVEEMRSMIEV